MTGAGDTAYMVENPIGESEDPSSLRFPRDDKGKNRYVLYDIWVW